MNRTLFFATAAIAVVSAAPVDAAPKAKSTTPAYTLSPSNPFYQRSTLPLETPDFSKIKDNDYLPAILAGMAQQKREVTAIANQRSAPAA